MQFLQAHREAVAGVGRQQPQVLGLADHHAGELRAVGRIEPAGERLAVAARRRQRVRRQRVGAPGAVDEHRRLQCCVRGQRPGRHRRSCRRARAGRCRGPWPSARSRRSRARPSPARWRCRLGLLDRLRRLALDDAACGARRRTSRRRRGSRCAISLRQLRLARQQRLELLALRRRALFCSSRIFISSSLARWRSLVSRIASACSSESLKRFISTGFGSSSRRMMRITSSRLR